MYFAHYERNFYPDLMNTFLVGNHCHIFGEDYQIKCTQHFKKEYYQKNIQKSGHKMDLYPALHLDLHGKCRKSHFTAIKWL